MSKANKYSTILNDKKLSEAATHIVKKVKIFMVYQFLNEDDIEGYKLSEDNEEYTKAYKISCFFLDKVVSELLCSTVDHTKKDLDNIYEMLKDYLCATNFIQEQKALGIAEKELRFFTFRNVTPLAQSYQMFYFIQFQEFCAEYFYSKFKSKTLEKIMIYDLACCEYSSYLDEKIPLLFRMDRKKKRSPFFLYWMISIRDIAKLLWNNAFLYMILALLFTNKDIAILFILIKITFQRDRFNEKVIAAMHGVYIQLNSATSGRLNIQANQTLRCAEIAAHKGVLYNPIMFNILDRAVAEKRWC